MFTCCWFQLRRRISAPLPPPLPSPQNIPNILKPLWYKNIHALKDFNQNLYNWLKSTKSKTPWFKEIELWVVVFGGAYFEMGYFSGGILVQKLRKFADEPKIQLTLTLRLEGIKHATWHSESEEVSHRASNFKFWTVRVNFGHVGVYFWPLNSIPGLWESIFWLWMSNLGLWGSIFCSKLSILGLWESISVGILESIFGPLGVEFWPLRVYFGPPEVCW